MKILSLWPWPQGHPRGGDGADKSFRPISTIMPNMNEIHQRVFKIWGLINFNAKTLTLRRKDERTNIRMNKRTYERTDWRTEKRKLYIPTYFVCRGYNKWGWDNQSQLYYSVYCYDKVITLLLGSRSRRQSKFTCYSSRQICYLSGNQWEQTVIDSSRLIFISIVMSCKILT